MKSERRHDLETNQLAVQLQDFLDRAKPYASQIALVIVGLAVLAFLGSMWGNANSAVEQTAWDEYNLASYSTDPELNSMKLLAENEEFSATPVPEWAYLAWADRQVLLASQSYLADRQTSMKRLEQVLPIFQGLADDSGNPQIVDRARFAIGQVLEMQGKVDDARKAYEKVKGDLSIFAETRAEQLDSSEVKTACDWLATADLPKREIPPTAGAAAGMRPNFEADVPSTKPIDTPITDTRTLEEIIGGESGIADEERYADPAEGETPAEPKADSDAPKNTETDEPTSEGP